MSTFRMLDAAGRPRSPATIPGNLAGRAPRNKGRRYPADPPRVEEIVAVLRRAGQGPHGARTRGLIVVLWRAGLRISEALELAERDLDPARGAILVRSGKGGKRREVGMDDWAGSSFGPGSSTEPRCRLAHSSASSTDRHADDRGRRRRSAHSCASSPFEPASEGALPRISFATRTPSRWPARACRST
jgi:Phage integrase family